MIEATSLEVRHAKMTAKANVAAASGNARTKKKLDSIRTIEAQVAMYRKIKAIRGKYNCSGFTSIKVPATWPDAGTDATNLQALPNPKKANTWKTIDLLAEIAYYLLICNRRHFRQAQGTTFTQPVLTRILDWAGYSRTYFERGF